jgi:hypothetical protein
MLIMVIFFELQHERLLDCFKQFAAPPLMLRTSAISLSKATVYASDRL